MYPPDAWWVAWHCGLTGRRSALPVGSGGIALRPEMEMLSGQIQKPVSRLELSSGQPAGNQRSGLGAVGSEGGCTTAGCCGAGGWF